MKTPCSFLFRGALLAAAAACSATFLTGSAHAADYVWTNYVSDIPGAALWTDYDLVNPWGIVPGPAGNIWTCDNGTGLLTRYDHKDGEPLNTGTGGPGVYPAIPITSSSANVAINGTNAISSPTGIRLNDLAVSTTGTGHGFVDPNTGTEAWLLIASKDGAVSTYSPIQTGTALSFTGTAAIVIDNSQKSGSNLTGAVYTGLALTATGTEVAPTTGANAGTETRHLYVANFHTGLVEVYNKSFTLVTKFSDPQITGTGSSPVLPTAPAAAASGTAWAPYNIKAIAIPGQHHNVNRYIFVTFAAQNAAKNDVVTGPGAGFIDVFDTAGTFLLRFASGGDLNTPWGIAYARKAFGKAEDESVSPPREVSVKNALLVGNYGDGTIHAYALSSLGTDIESQTTEGSIGVLEAITGSDLQFDGLRGLHFGRPETAKQIAADPDDLNEDGGHLFFSAEFTEGSGGLGGVIEPHGGPGL